MKKIRALTAESVLHTLQSLRSGLKTGEKCFIQGSFLWVPAGVLLHVVFFWEHLFPILKNSKQQTYSALMKVLCRSVWLCACLSVCLSVEFLSSSFQSILETRFSFFNETSIGQCKYGYSALSCVYRISAWLIYKTVPRGSQHRKVNKNKLAGFYTAYHMFRNFITGSRPSCKPYNGK